MTVSAPMATTISRSSRALPDPTQRLAIGQIESFAVELEAHRLDVRHRVDADIREGWQLRGSAIYGRACRVGCHGNGGCWVRHRFLNAGGGSAHPVDRGSPGGNAHSTYGAGTAASHRASRTPLATSTAGPARCTDPFSVWRTRRSPPSTRTSYAKGPPPPHQRAAAKAAAAAPVPQDRVSPDPRS